MRYIMVPPMNCHVIQFDAQRHVGPALYSNATAHKTVISRLGPFCVNSIVKGMLLFRQSDKNDFLQRSSAEYSV